MKDVEIFEQTLMNGDRSVGKLAIIRGGLVTDNPTALLNNIISTYVEDKGYNEFVEIELDNPWVRVIISGINEVNYVPFNDQRL